MKWWSRARAPIVSSVSWSLDPTIEVTTRIDWIGVAWMDTVGAASVSLVLTTKQWAIMVAVSRLASANQSDTSPIDGNHPSGESEQRVHVRSGHFTCRQLDSRRLTAAQAVASPMVTNDRAGPISSLESSN